MKFCFKSFKSFFYLLLSRSYDIVYSEKLSLIASVAKYTSSNRSVLHYLHSWKAKHQIGLKRYTVDSRYFAFIWIQFCHLENDWTILRIKSFEPREWNLIAWHEEVNNSAWLDKNVVLDSWMMIGNFFDIIAIYNHISYSILIWFSDFG